MYIFTVVTYEIKIDFRLGIDVVYTYPSSQKQQTNLLYLRSRQLCFKNKSHITQLGFESITRGVEP